MAQKPGAKYFWDSLLIIETQNIATREKLQKVLVLKKQFEDNRLPEDSVYARLLHRMAAYEFSLKNNIATVECITATRHALAINTSGKKYASESFASGNSFNLGLYYASAGFTDKALSYYDTAIILAERHPQAQAIILRAIKERILLLFEKGDYQQCVDESTIGINDARKMGMPDFVMSFLNQRGHALFYRGELKRSMSDADSAMQYAQVTNDNDELAFASKTKAKVYGALLQYTKAETYFIQAIQSRMKGHIYELVAADYIDFGNYYLAVKKEYGKAENCYQMALQNAAKANSVAKVAIVNANLDAFYFYQANYTKALQYNTMALANLLQKKRAGGFDNISADSFNTVANKELLFVIFYNKTETLTRLYEQTNDKKYLNLAMQAAYLTDTLLSNMRHSQTGEQSKLYWRKLAKPFYAVALQACYLANDYRRAFYLMEKSRGVLLNDALNEIGAADRLTAGEQEEMEKLQVSVAGQQQALAGINVDSPLYKMQEDRLLRSKDVLELYIKSLEKKHPEYYTYKFADNVPPLGDMQKNLAPGNRVFIHYFIADTTAFILATTANSVKFIHLSSKEFNRDDVNEFARYCADRDAANSHYAAFAQLSNKLFNALFKPLQLPPGQVTICTDDFIIPFEALCSDSTGTNFLINNYTFSYVYSASYLLRSFGEKQPDGNFFGIAPVNFTAYAGLPNLVQSDEALEQSRQYYTGTKLFVNNKATRGNFFRYAPSYSVVTVFSHASADTTGNEPLVYMKDSAIKLSELLYFKNPATQLVILSACETNAGKKATGEGIYSLARGFSSAGIPSVAATLWKADDLATYAITQEFNRNLANGMQKDEALRQAKLTYIKQGQPNALPYLWANMIITGNVQPLQLTKGVNYLPAIVCIAVPLLLLAFVVVYLLVQRNRRMLQLAVKPNHYTV